MHPFTSLTLWFWLSFTVVLLPFDWPLIVVSLVTFAMLLAWRQARYRYRYVIGLMLPMALGLWLIHSGWLTYCLTGEFSVATQQQKALALWFRLLAIISSAQLWLQYVSTEKLIRALFASRLPTSFSYLLAGPLLFVEQLRQQISSIKEAQLARGVPLDGNLLQRFMSLPALILPLATQALSELAIRGAALDMRGFRAVSQRTTLGAPKDNLFQAICRYAILVIIIIEGGIDWWW